MCASLGFFSRPIKVAQRQKKGKLPEFSVRAERMGDEDGDSVRAIWNEKDNIDSWWIVPGITVADIKDLQKAGQRSEPRQNLWEKKDWQGANVWIKDSIREGEHSFILWCRSADRSTGMSQLLQVNTSTETKDKIFDFMKDQGEKYCNGELDRAAMKLNKKTFIDDGGCDAEACKRPAANQQQGSTQHGRKTPMKGAQVKVGAVAKRPAACEVEVGAVAKRPAASDVHEGATKRPAAAEAGAAKHTADSCQVSESSGNDVTADDPDLPTLPSIPELTSDARFG